MGYWNRRVDFNTLEGKILTKVWEQNDVVYFECAEGLTTLEHIQDCCESVWVEDIIGDFDDLIGTPILVAHEREGGYEGPKRDHTPESETWTFYTIRTIKGTVDIRFCGESNGYYSESVDCLWDPNEEVPVEDESPDTVKWQDSPLIHDDWKRSSLQPRAE